MLYLAPASVIEEWSKTEPAKRKEAEEKMQGDWRTWMKEHGNMLKETAGTGKTKRVTKGGTTDTKNDIMLYSVIEADSAESAAKIFEGHPHLDIPEASIEIMPINLLPSAM